jgi:hypothetical protein
MGVCTVLLFLLAYFVGKHCVSIRTFNRSCTEIETSITAMKVCNLSWSLEKIPIATDVNSTGRDSSLMPIMEQ